MIQVPNIVVLYIYIEQYCALADEKKLSKYHVLKFGAVSNEYTAKHITYIYVFTKLYCVHSVVI